MRRGNPSADFVDEVTPRRQPSGKLQRRLVMIFLTVLTIAIMAPPSSLGQTGASRTLDVYVIDVEGGNAVLFATPSHESLLMDTGNAGAVAAPAMRAALSKR